MTRAELCPACHNEQWRYPHNCTDGPPPQTVAKYHSEMQRLYELRRVLEAAEGADDDG